MRPIAIVGPETRHHFLGDLGLALEIGQNSVSGSLILVPELCLPGDQRVRTGVLCTIADVVAGRLAAIHTAPRLAVTTNLSCVVHGHPPSDRMVARARILKAGRTTIVTETSYYPSTGPTEAGVASGAVFATCFTSFMSSARPGDVLPPIGAPRIPIGGQGVPTLSAPILTRVGCIEVAPGVLEAPLTADVANSAGFLQGGAVALMADGAAQSAVDCSHNLRGSVVQLDVRYLDALRVGPVRSSVQLVSRANTGDSWWRVELRDVGNQNRLGTVALARHQVTHPQLPA